MLKVENISEFDAQQPTKGYVVKTSSQGQLSEIKWSLYDLENNCEVFVQEGLIGTRNLAAYFGIVDALQWLLDNGKESEPLYVSNLNSMKWVEVAHKYDDEAKWTKFSLPSLPQTQETAVVLADANLVAHSIDITMFDIRLWDNNNWTKPEDLS